MGWGDCGTDSRGRPIGYVFSARCDHPGCKAKIDRGLSYACGGMHGTSIGCENYFCGEHMHHGVHDPGEGSAVQMCISCTEDLKRIQLEEAQDLLLEVAKLAISGDVKRLVYAFMERWDEIDDVPIDEQHQSESLVARLKRRDEIRESFHG